MFMRKGENMEVFLWIILILLALQLGFVVWNMRYLKPLGQMKQAKSKLQAEPSLSEQEMSAVETTVVYQKADLPLISVLIHASNEERYLIFCIRSVLSSTYQNIEILILNDDSTGTTAAHARSMSKLDGRIKVLEVDAIREGWIGKVYARHLLAQAAKGRWLLFLDANARLHSEAIQAALDSGNAQGGGMISGYPMQLVESSLEKLILPLMMFTIACFVPIRFILRSPIPLFVAAHEAFMFIHEATYHKAGGYQAVRNQLAYDFQLAKAVKASGEPVQFADVHRHVFMRMYYNTRELWAVSKKNIPTYIGNNMLSISLILWFNGIMYVAPAAVLLVELLMDMRYPIAPIDGGLDVIMIQSAAAYVMGCVIKLIIDVRQGQSPWLAWLLPVSVVLSSLIVFSSCRTAKGDDDYEWKGLSGKGGSSQ
jgi:glycosyltransferase involved in cell wall biosynthesis